MTGKGISYKSSDDAYVISIVPDVALDAEFWEGMAEAEGDVKLPYQLALHEVLMHPGLHFDSWEDELELVCPDGDNPKHFRSPSLPKDNLGLALLGRLKGWKLCTVEIYSSEFWLHFYNAANREWQSGMLFTVTEMGTKRRPPAELCIREKDGEYTTIEWHDGVDVFRGESEECQKCEQHDASECSFCDYVKVSVVDAESNETLRSVIINGKGGSAVREYIDENVYERLFKE